ncbi:hypothetical protein D9M70_532340 [compost metagenome]
MPTTGVKPSPSPAPVAICTTGLLALNVPAANVQMAAALFVPAWMLGPLSPSWSIRQNSAEVTTPPPPLDRCEPTRFQPGGVGRVAVIDETCRMASWPALHPAGRLAVNAADVVTLFSAATKTGRASPAAPLNPTLTPVDVGNAAGFASLLHVPVL